MRRLLMILPLIVGAAAAPASAYQFILENARITSFSVSGANNPLPPGSYDLVIKGDWPSRLVGKLEHQGRETDEFPLTIANCREDDARPTAEFARPSNPRTHLARLLMTAAVEVPDKRDPELCDIVADLPLAGGLPPAHDRPNPGGPGQGGNAPAPPSMPGGLTQGEVPPTHDRPNPGGPGQGNFAAPALPNLQIRSAKAIGGSAATELGVTVVNTGAGPSPMTALKLFYSKDGATTTASANVPALAAGQKTVVNVGTGKPLADADGTNLRVDDPNTVSETNEGDNSFIFTN